MSTHGGLIRPGCRCTHLPCSVRSRAPPNCILLANLCCLGTPNAHLSITKPLATTFPTPNQIVGQVYSVTMYFITKTTTLPANPPANSANPRNRTSLAFQATPLPEYEKLSADSRDLSMLLITSIPSAEQIPGIQSTNVMCTGGSDGFMTDLDQTDISIRV